MKTSEGAPKIYPIIDYSTIVGIEEEVEENYFVKKKEKKSYKNTIKYCLIGILLYLIVRYFR